MVAWEGWKRIKSRLRRKKTAPMACRTAVYGDAGRWVGMAVVESYIPTYEWLATTDPPRLIALASAVSKLRFRLRLRLHGIVHNTPSPMAGLLHIEIAGVVRRVRWVMRMLSALFPRLLLHIRASQGGVMRDWCYALLDGGARPSLTAFREGITSIPWGA